jgi:nucleotide-binding universal stress UspA family protein
MTMQIVVGVDGSDPSIEAVRWATHEARRRDAEMRVVSCYTLPVCDGSKMAVHPSAFSVESIKEGAAAVVGRATDVVEIIDPTLVVEGVTLMSSAVLGVTEAAGAGDEIVVGATGHSGFLDGLIGSVATGVTHRAHVPVIVVPAKSSAVAGDAMKKIVVGVDGSPGSLRALDWAFAEALLTGAELTVVHAWMYPYAGPQESISELREQMGIDAMQELRSSFDSLGSRLTDGTVTVHPRLCESTPAEALLKEADHADLVVVGSRGRSGLRSLLLGSVSKTVLQDAPCPVAVIRPAEN